MHDSTGFTSYKLVYGKEARLPIDMQARVGAGKEDSFDENGDDFSPEAKEEGKEGLERKHNVLLVCLKKCTLQQRLTSRKVRRSRRSTLINKIKLQILKLAVQFF